MKRLIRSLLHYCRRLYLLTLKLLSLCWPKDNNLILFSSWFGKKYADNSMYLFEYMLKYTQYKVVWFTREKKIYDKLKEEGKPVVFGSTIKACYYHLRAKVFVSTVQFCDFNAYLMANCILLDLDHGFPAKYVHFVSPTITRREIEYEMLLRRWVKYYMTASSKFTMQVVSKCFALSPDNIIFSNKPRVDVFFDEKLRIGENEIVDIIKGGNKAIVWMPTQRSQGETVIDVNMLLDLDEIEEICKEIGAVFIIKKHFYHRNEVTNLSKYTRIFDITQEDVDVQALLFQADALISDYSSCYIEYLTMDRPIILYIYDLEKYLITERDVCVKMEDNHVGYKIRTKEELSNCLRNIGEDWFDIHNQGGREEAKKRYFDQRVEMGNSRKKLTKVIENLIDGTFVPFDWSK